MKFYKKTLDVVFNRLVAYGWRIKKTDDGFNRDGKYLDKILVGEDRYFLKVTGPGLFTKMEEAAVFPEGISLEIIKSLEICINFARIHSMIIFKSN